MTEKLEIYKCNVCGNIVQVLVSSFGSLVCCGQEMEHLVPKNVDEYAEKHVPVTEQKENGETVVVVGSEMHPMSDEHYIVMIEAISKDKNKVELEFLYPSMKPQMLTNIADATALEYCNIHGLWGNIND